jgi:hypothetical protein
MGLTHGIRINVIKFESSRRCRTGISDLLTKTINAAIRDPTSPRRSLSARSGCLLVHLLWCAVDHIARYRFHRVGVQRSGQRWQENRSDTDKWSLGRSPGHVMSDLFAWLAGLPTMNFLNSLATKAVDRSQECHSSTASSTSSGKGATYDPAICRGPPSTHWRSRFTPKLVSSHTYKGPSQI